MSKEIEKHVDANDSKFDREISAANPMLHPEIYHGVPSFIVRVVKIVYKRYQQLKLEKPEWLEMLRLRDEQIYYLKNVDIRNLKEENQRLWRRYEDEDDQMNKLEAEISRLKDELHEIKIQRKIDGDRYMKKLYKLREKKNG